MSCSLCDMVVSMKAGTYPFVIHEFKHSFLMLGEHQFYNGYSVLVTKKHFREMTDIPEIYNTEFFHEMMTASKAVDKAFGPKKMNMCSLGNVCDHVHWHFFPRYESDPEFLKPPFLRMHLFDSAKITPAQATINIEKIRQFL